MFTIGGYVLIGAYIALGAFSILALLLLLLASITFFKDYPLYFISISFFILIKSS
jgi:hypothetical protein